MMNKSAFSTSVHKHLCELCNQEFNNQFKFYEHLKAHYEDVSSTLVGGFFPRELQLQCESSVPTVNMQEIKTLESDPSYPAILDRLDCQNVDNKSFDSGSTFTTYECHQNESQADMRKDNRIPSESPKFGEDFFTNSNDFVDDSQLVVYEKDYLCPKCDFQCDTPEGFDAHVLESHPETKAQNDSFQETRKTKPSKLPVSFDCNLCDRKFTSRSSLSYHLRSHSGERPFDCETCKKKFFSSSALKVHLRQHSGEKPFVCPDPLCGRSFRQWGDLKYHQQSIHSGVRAFQCEFCGKNFARNYSLVVHRRVHTGERQYKCEICSKTFRASCYLNSHRKIHTGEKSHVCQMCGKGFRVRSDMKRHLLAHEKKMKHVEITITPLEVVQVLEKTESSNETGNEKTLILAPAQPTLDANSIPATSWTDSGGSGKPGITSDVELNVPLPSISINGQNSQIIGELTMSIPHQETENQLQENNLPNNIIILDYPEGNIR